MGSRCSARQTSARGRGNCCFTQCYEESTPISLADTTILGMGISSTDRISDKQSVAFRMGALERHWFMGKNEKTGERIQVSYGTPVMGWPVWRAIHLPEDKVLFQLGESQLCILDVPHKRVAIFARGRGPVALMDAELLNRIPVSGTRKPADVQPLMFWLAMDEELKKVLVEARARIIWGNPISEITDWLKEKGLQKLRSKP